RDLTDVGSCCLDAADGKIENAEVDRSRRAARGALAGPVGDVLDAAVIAKVVEVGVAGVRAGRSPARCGSVDEHIVGLRLQDAAVGTPDTHSGGIVGVLDDPLDASAVEPGESHGTRPALLERAGDPVKDGTITVGVRSSGGSNKTQSPDKEE